MVDSVTFHFRQDFRDMALRTRLLTQMAQDCMQLAESHGIAVRALHDQPPPLRDRLLARTRYAAVGLLCLFSISYISFIEVVIDAGKSNTRRMDSRRGQGGRCLLGVVGPAALST